ncbi:hypothetical protein ABE83_07405 [Streptomyces sp. CFMR 7]|nr:hypothetical protein ABE83_07405 [Streptomyces sp. CFMR 7]
MKAEHCAELCPWREYREGARRGQHLYVRTRVAERQGSHLGRGQRFRDDDMGEDPPTPHLDPVHNHLPLYGQARHQPGQRALRGLFGALPVLHIRRRQHIRAVVELEQQKSAVPHDGEHADADDRRAPVLVRGPAPSARRG